MTLSDEELVLYADGALSEERRQEIIQSAAHDPELAEILAALDASRLPYQAAFQQKSEPPVPEHIRNTVRQLINENAQTGAAPEHSVAESANVSSSERRVWPSWFLQAACLVLSLGVGYIAGSGLLSHDRSTATAGDLDWVQRVADYQSLYVPNTVRHIEVDQAASQKTLDTIAKSSGLTTAIPDLTASGYAFVRAQELGFEGEPLVQLVYHKEGRPPLALCYMAASQSNNTPVHLQDFHGLSTASWTDDQQRYVIVAEESAETLTELYENIAQVFKTS